MEQSNVSARPGKASCQRQPQKPVKPHPDFPLTAHPSGRWCKKVRGIIHYFGPWRNPQGAIEEWLRIKDDLLAGRKPRPKGADAGVTVKFVIDSYLTRKEASVTAETSRTGRSKTPTPSACGSPMRSVATGWWTTCGRMISRRSAWNWRKHAARCRSEMKSRRFARFSNSPMKSD